MREIGTLLELREVFAYQGSDAWGLAFDAQTRFDAEYEPVLNRLVLSAPIAGVPQGSRLALYEILLQYNAAWTETGGARMALDGESGDVVMLFDLPAADLHLGLLAQVLANLAGIQRAWREILLGLSARVDAGSSPPSGGEGAHIRIHP